MNTNFDDLATDDDDLDDVYKLTPEPKLSKVSTDVDVILNDLEMMANDFSDHVQKIRLMQENGFFKFASKATRNTLMTGLLKRVDIIDETTKVAFRSLKKVKRVRVPEVLIDNLMISSVSVLPGRL
jgi:hypothetical protein